LEKGGSLIATVIGATHQLIRKIGNVTLLTLLFLWAGMGCLVFGFSASIKGLDGWPLFGVAVAGVLTTWLLARSRLSGWVAAALALLGGIVGIGLTIGRLSGLLLRLSQAAASYESQVVRFRAWTPEQLAKLDVIPLMNAWQELIQGATTLGVRTLNWIRALTTGHPAYDPLAIVLVWSLVVWIVAVWAAWFIRRQGRPLLALFPIGLLLAIDLAYTGTSLYPLISWIGVVVIMQALGSYSIRTTEWRRSGTDQAEIEGEWALAVAFIAVALMSCAAVVPSISVRKIAQSVEQKLAPQGESSRAAAEAFGLKPAPPTPGRLASSYTPGLPNLHLLGSGPELSQKVVMWVSLAGPNAMPTPTPSSQPASLPQRYYWRGLTYDSYTGHGWFTTPNQLVEYKAGQPVQGQEPGSSPGSYEVVRQHVQPVENLGQLLYATGELLTASRDFKVTLRSPEDMFGAETQPGDYWADSRLPLATADQLRKTGSNYPDWVAKRYLALPDELPFRVRQLALDLTAVKPDPYDRALAIEMFLREFPYTLDLAAPPAGRDVVDYFLFDLKKGYCDYYASAMTILARAAGLPARLVVGYASGNYDPQHARYEVTEADAHAWTEIYFPGYGWVEFEPTGGRPPLERAGENGQPGINPHQLEQPLPPITQLTPSSTLIWKWVLYGVAFLLIVVWLVWSATERIWLNRLSPGQVTQVIYRRLFRLSTRLQVPLGSSTTPHEVVSLLGQRLDEIIPARSRGALLKGFTGETRQLTDLYASSIYSPHPSGEIEKTTAIQTWRKLQPYFWRAWLWNIWHRFRPGHR
jgi:transglutaminase-like putative cysteine protease